MKLLGVAWFKKQPLPIKALVVVAALYLLARIISSRQAAAGGAAPSWDPRKYLPGGRWGGL